MTEEKHHEHKTENQEKKEEHKKFSFKLSKWDIISIILLIIFVALVAIPVYTYNEDCEVARPNYKCDSIKNVMIENCVYWGNYNCDSNADLSLPDIEFYIGGLCELQNKHHNTGLDCSNLKSACNKISGNQLCPLGY